MKVIHTDHFGKSLADLPTIIQKKFKKQVGYLANDIRHPSLRAKKFDETRGVWQARVDKYFRFYFIIQNDVYKLIDITDHPV